MSKAIIIPSRYESSRFPGKPLATISGKPMIQWVIESALKSKLADKVIVATDDTRIYDFVSSIVGSSTLGVEMTSPNHQCGSDRITEVINKNLDIEYIVNLQGDEPLIPPEYIDKVLEPLLNESSAMATLITPITSTEELNDPNIVKAVKDSSGNALYFSRSPIPFNRDPKSSTQTYYRHLGIYSYTRESLLRFSSLPQSELEQIEKLEQLRALENGIQIKAKIVSKTFPSVDSPEHIKEIEKLISAT